MIEAMWMWMIAYNIICRPTTSMGGQRHYEIPPRRRQFSMHWWRTEWWHPPNSCPSHGRRLWPCRMVGVDDARSKHYCGRRDWRVIDSEYFAKKRGTARLLMKIHDNHMKIWKRFENENNRLLMVAVGTVQYFKYFEVVVSVVSSASITCPPSRFSLAYGWRIQS